MRIAVLGDAHLIADDDPHADLRRVRTNFHQGVPAFRRMISWLNTLELDAVLSVGDVVDWCSDANVALAVHLLSELNCPWHMTPGNHDLEFPKPGIPADSYALLPQIEHQREAFACWTRHGVDLSDRRITIGNGEFIFLDSSMRAINTDAATKLLSTATAQAVVLTHVPLDLASVRSFIRSRDQHRNLEVYTQSRSPDFFSTCIAGRIHKVLSGHLHFPGSMHEQGCTFHFLDASFARGTKPPTVSLLEDHSGELTVTSIQAPPPA